MLILCRALATKHAWEFSFLLFSQIHCSDPVLIPKRDCDQVKEMKLFLWESFLGGGGGVGEMGEDLDRERTLYLTLRER